MATLYNEKGEPIEVAEADVPQAVLSKRAFFRKNDRVAITTTAPDGTDHFGTVPASSVYHAFTNGWRFDGDSAAERQLQAAHGTPLEMLKTFGEGALNAATLGAGNMAEAEMFGNGAEQQARERANPITAGAGNVAGIVLPALVGDELGPASLLANAGKGVETALGKGVIGAVGRGAFETGVFGGADELKEEVLGDKPIAAQKILSSATLSGLFGGGVSGMFHLAGALAAGAFGKAAAAFAPAASSGQAPGTIEAAVDAVTSKQEADPTTFIQKVVDGLWGKDKRAAAGRLMSRDVRDLARTAESDANLQFIDGAKAVQDHVDDFDRAAKHISQVQKPAEVMAALASVDPTVPRQDAYGLANEIRTRIKHMQSTPEDFFHAPQIAQLERQADRIDKAVGAKMVPTGKVVMVNGVAELEKVKMLDPRADVKTEDVWKALNRTKQILDDVGDLNAATAPEHRGAVREVNNFRVKIRNMLIDKNLFGGAATTQAKYNDLTHRWIGAAEAFLESKAVGYRDGNFVGGKPSFSINPKSIETFFRELGDPGNEIRKKAFVEYLRVSKEVAGNFLDDENLQARLRNTFTKTEDLSKLARAMSDLKQVRSKASAVEGVIASPIGRAVLGGFLGGAPGAFAAAAAPTVGSAVLHMLDQVAARNGAEIRAAAAMIAKGSRPAGGRAPVIALKILEAARFTDIPYADKAKTKEEAFARRASELRDAVANPAATEATVRARLAPIGKEAPQTGEAMVAQAMRSIFYLANALPPQAAASPFASPLRKSVQSEVDIREFAQAVKAVNDPMSVLEDVVHGRLSMRAAAALRETNPELYNEMRVEIVRAIEENGGKGVKYDTRLKLGLFFGEPIDPTLDPTFLQAAQSSYSQGENQQGDKPLKSTKEIKSIRNAASATQSLEMKTSPAPVE